MSRQYHVAKHKATGLLMVIHHYKTLTPAQIKSYIEYPGEVPHILFREKIAKNPKLRKRGIWQYDKDDKYTVYFTCPWCAKISMTSHDRVGPVNGGESIFCSSRGVSGRAVDTLRSTTLSVGIPNLWRSNLHETRDVLAFIPTENYPASSARCPDGLGWGRTP